MLGHDRTVSCLALDPSGSRLLSGSLDDTIKFWDWNSMDEEHRHFRSIEPAEVKLTRSLISTRMTNFERHMREREEP